MANIDITLLTNKRTRQSVDGLDTIVAAQAGGYSVIEGEDEATEFAVHYPEGYIGQTGYVYMKNARGEYYVKQFGVLTSSAEEFTLPASMTYEGNTVLVFYASTGSGDNLVKTVWAPVIVPVLATSVDYARVAVASPDMLAEVIATANAALTKATAVETATAAGEYNGNAIYETSMILANGGTGLMETSDVLVPTGRSLKVYDLVLDPGGKVGLITNISGSYATYAYRQTLKGANGSRGSTGPGIYRSNATLAMSGTDNTVLRSSLYVPSGASVGVGDFLLDAASTIGQVTRESYPVYTTEMFGSQSRVAEFHFDTSVDMETMLAFVNGMPYEDPYGWYNQWVCFLIGDVDNPILRILKIPDSGNFVYTLQVWNGDRENGVPTVGSFVDVWTSYFFRGWSDAALTADGNYTPNTAFQLLLIPIFQEEAEHPWNGVWAFNRLRVGMELTYDFYTSIKGTEGLSIFTCTGTLATSGTDHTIALSAFTLPEGRTLQAGDLILDAYGTMGIITVVGTVYVTYNYKQAVKGDNGIGIPTGGTTAQILTKVNSTDYNTAWTTLNIDPITQSVSLSSTAALSLTPNVYYVITGDFTSLTFSFMAGTAGRIAEYSGQFSSGDPIKTITFPSSVKWVGEAGGIFPVLEASKTYQFSVLNNIGVIVGV